QRCGSPGRGDRATHTRRTDDPQSVQGWLLALDARRPSHSADTTGPAQKAGPASCAGRAHGLLLDEFEAAALRSTARSIRVEHGPGQEPNYEVPEWRSTT